MEKAIASAQIDTPKTVLPSMRYLREQLATEKTLQSDNQILKKKTEELAAELTVIMKEKCELETANRDKCKAVHLLKKQIETLQSDNQVLKKTIEEQAAELTVMMKEKCELETANRDKCKAVHLLKQQMDSLQYHIQILKKSKEEQAAELTVMMKEKCELETANRDKCKAVHLLKQQMDSLQYHIQILKKSKEEQAAELIRLKEMKMSTRFSQMKMLKKTQTDEEELLFSDDLPSTNQSMISNTYVSYIPVRTNMWFSTLVERLPGVEPSCHSNSATIKMMQTTLEMENCANFVETKVREAQRFGNKVFYHGTDKDSAASILQNGINVKKSYRKVDFSNGRGFYVTDNFTKAAEWSGRVARRKHTTSVVIAFKIAANLLSGTTHLSLNANTDTDRKWLECIVSHFRHGKTSPDVSNVLRDVKYIEGPVAKVKDLGLQEIPTFHSFNQLCICDNNYARQFGSLDNILFVIFN